MEAERNDELKNAPVLRAMKKQTPFTVPDGYFDSLSGRIQDRINAPKPATIWEKLLSPLQRPAFVYVSITVAMLICAGVYFSQNNSANKKQVAEFNITSDDLYNSGIIYDYDEHILAEALAANTQDQQITTEVEDYLIDSDTDESDLINAL